jgi:hypothetical protein
MRSRYFLEISALALVFCAQSYAGSTISMLNGGEEVPPVNTKASATCSITIDKQRQVSGELLTTGIEGTMAHIHLGDAGKNGPIVVTLIKSSPHRWTVPEGTTLTPEQYSAFLQGVLYANVHSAAHPAGEIRLQLH